MKASIANQIHEQNGLLIIYMAKHQTGDELTKLKDSIIRYSQKSGNDVDILVDVSDVKSSDESANSVARTFFKDLPFRYMAVYGGNRAVNVGIKLILNLFISMGAGEVRLFKTELKAREWLESESSPKTRAPRA